MNVLKIIYIIMEKINYKIIKLNFQFAELQDRKLTEVWKNDIGILSEYSISKSSEFKHSYVANWI